MTVPSQPFRRGRFEDLPHRPRLAHPYEHATAREVTVASGAFGSTRLHVRSFGSGPPLLLVHGLMTSSYSFRYLLEPLGRSHTVIVPDLPGCGRSEPRADRPHTTAALAELLGDLLRALGIEGCPAIGNSMGGYLAMHVALARPRAFSRLVVAHAPAIADLRLRVLHAALALPGAARVLAALVGRSPERWAHANVHYRDETLKSREEALEYGAPLSTPAGIQSFYRYLYETLDPGEMRAFCRRLRGTRFPVPLSLIYATEDPMVPPRVGPALHALVPTAEFHWLDRSSHFAHVDSPERFLRLVEPFLAAGEPVRPLRHPLAASG